MNDSGHLYIHSQYTKVVWIDIPIYQYCLIHSINILVANSALLHVTILFTAVRFEIVSFLHYYCLSPVKRFRSNFGSYISAFLDTFFYCPGNERKQIIYSPFRIFLDALQISLCIVSFWSNYIPALWTLFCQVAGAIRRNGKCNWKAILNKLFTWHCVW